MLIKNLRRKIKINYLITLAVILITFLRLITYYLHLQHSQIFMSSDDAIYGILSERLLKGDILGAVHPYWNPGFPMLSIPFHFITHNWKMAQIALSIFSQAALAIATFLFYRRFSIRLSFFVFFITIFSAGLQKLVLKEGITEPVYILFLWSSLYMGYMAITSRKIKLFFWTGILFGLTYLIRTDVSFIYLSFLMFNVIYSLILTGKENFRSKIKIITVYTLVTFLAFLVVNIPYLAIQSIHLGKFTFSGKYSYIGSGPPYAIEKYRSTTWAQDIFSIDFPDYHSPYYNSQRALKNMYIAIKTGSFTQTGIKTFKESIEIYKSKNSDNFFQGLELDFALVGLIVGLIRLKFRKLTLFLLIMIFSGLLWVSFFMAPLFRYLSFTFPFFFYLEAQAFVFLIDIITFFLRGLLLLESQMISLLVSLLIVLNFLNNNVNLITFLNSKGDVRYLNHYLIGTWLKNQQIGLIGGRREGINFYADAKLVYIPSAPPDEIISYLKKWGIEYMVIQPDDAGYWFVRPITDSNYQNPNLTLVHRFDDGTLVWKVILTAEEKADNERIRVWKSQI